MNTVALKNSKHVEVLPCMLGIAILCFLPIIIASTIAFLSVIYLSQRVDASESNFLLAGYAMFNALACTLLSVSIVEYSDVVTYQEIFRRVASPSGQVFGLEPGLVVFFWLFAQLGLGFWEAVFCLLLLANLLVFKEFSARRSLVPLAIGFVLSLFPILINKELFLLRHFVSCALLVVALNRFAERRPFILIFLGAVSFHLASLMYLPIFFLKRNLIFGVRRIFTILLICCAVAILIPLSVDLLTNIARFLAGNTVALLARKAGQYAAGEAAGGNVRFLTGPEFVLPFIYSVCALLLLVLQRVRGGRSADVPDSVQVFAFVLLINFIALLWLRDFSLLARRVSLIVVVFCPLFLQTITSLARPFGIRKLVCAAFVTVHGVYFAAWLWENDQGLSFTSIAQGQMATSSVVSLMTLLIFRAESFLG